MEPNLASDVTVKLDLVTFLTNASWPVTVTILLLLAASTAVWIAGILKLLQIARLRSSARSFELRAQRVRSADELFSLIGREPESSGLRVLEAMMTRTGVTGVDRLRAAADRAVVDEKHRARTLMPVLASIGSASPFVGLFGTVYGIMDAFVRIGAAKSASLPVVAPAIGEALFTTALGLAAAIPAVLFYNSIDKRISDYVSELEASASEWVAVLASGFAAEQPVSQPKGVVRAAGAGPA